MKIAQITPGLIQIPPNGWGAVEKIIWAYKLEMEKLGHEVDIKYSKEVQQGDYDIVHVHVANLAINLADRNIPYVFTMHDHHSEVFGKFSQCFQENSKAIERSVLSLVPAEHLISYFGSPSNLRYLPHGVDVNFFETKVREVSRSDHRLLCVGKNGYFNDENFDRKGFGLALEAAQELDLPLTVAGPKSNKAFFESIFASYDKLNLIFDLTEEQLKEQYGLHTIFLHPSIIEAGHPNLTLLEAMSMGLPVVGTYSGVEFELNGILRVEREVDQIVFRCKQVIDDYEAFSRSAIRSAHSLTWEYVSERLCSYYKNPTQVTPEGAAFAEKHVQIYEKVKNKKVKNNELGIDKIYVINLKNRTDRKKRILRLLDAENLGIPIEFLEGVDLRGLKNKEIEEWFSQKGYKVYSDWRMESPSSDDYLVSKFSTIKTVSVWERWDTNDMSKGEMGCGLSHINAWNKGHKENLDKALILEDDAYWESGKLTEGLTKINQCKANWEMAYLGRNKMDSADEEVVDDFFVRPKFSFNAHAYVVTKEGFKRLVGYHAEKNLMVADEILSASVAGHRRVDIEKVFPKIMDGIAPPPDQCFLWQESLFSHAESDVSGDRKFEVSFIDKPKLEITTDQVSTETFHVNFLSEGVSVFETSLTENTWAEVSLERRVPWEIQVSSEMSNEVCWSHKYNDENQQVMVWFDSKSLGDNLAWMPQVERFRKISKSRVILSSFWNGLFRSEYPEIEFIEPGSESHNLYASYRIGCFDLDDRNLSGRPWNKIALGEVCSDILGIPYREEKAKVLIKDKTRREQQKYVCISTSSTAGCKHWHGWQEVVDYLNSKGYKVVVIQKEPLDYMDLKGLENVIFPDTKDSIEEAMAWLYHCEFYIGFSSGISWLAHSLGKEVIMIAGFTEPYNEFTCRRVINYNACHGCWHNHLFDKGIWNWCPEHKDTERQFECMETIKLEDIIKVMPLN